MSSASQQQAAPIVIETQANPQHAVIWLHGLGANGHDFAPVVPEVSRNNVPMRFIFPNAPERPVTVNGGYKMPAWYDIKGPDLSDKEDLAGISASSAYLNDLIELTIADDIAAENIVIAGFSQGGAVANYTLIRSQHKLAGCLALSTYIPFMRDSAQQLSSSNLNTPVFWGHGSHDDIVSQTLGEKSTQHLQDLGFKVEWHLYPMAHSVHPEEIVDIRRWLQKIFAE